jgi:predicted dehydrogenase
LDLRIFSLIRKITIQKREETLLFLAFLFFGCCLWFNFSEMKEKVRIGIIGTGFARTVQIPAFLECSDAQIVSVASGQIENARKTAEQFNIEHFTNDWRETVERADIDLICITTPPDTHCEMTLRAIECGKHVLCEKPMAMDVEEARQMTEKRVKRMF